MGSGRFANGFIISGMPSCVKGISNNLAFISANTGAAAINGFSNPSLSAFSWKACITLSEIFSGLNTASLTVPKVLLPTLSIACLAN